MATELATRNHLAARRIAPTHANHASQVKRVCHHSVFSSSDARCATRSNKLDLTGLARDMAELGVDQGRLGNREPEASLRIAACASPPRIS
jgi:hypothetical protein